MMIKNLLDTNPSIDKLKLELEKLHPHDIALELPLLTKEEREKIYKALNTSEMALVFSYIDEEDANLFNELNNEYAAQIIENMPSDDATDILQNMDLEHQDAILNLVDEEAKEDILDLVKYEDNQAGSIMTKDFISVSPNMDVKDAMKILVKNAPSVETINTIFVCDDDEKLLGVIDLKKLIVSKTPKKIIDIMNDNFQYASPLDDIEDVLKQIRDYDIYALPILTNGVIDGIITMDDAMERFTEEAGEDYAKFAGLTSEDDSLEGTLSAIKKRIPWLAILLVVDIFVSLIISRFELVINEVTVLVLFQTVILGLSGNSGTQALAVCVRKLSNGEINSKKDEFKHLFQEVRIGLLQGLIVGLFVFVLSTIFLLVKKYPEPYIVSGLISFSIISALTVSSLFGALLPILFTKMHIDPAVASGPFITTVNDILSVVIYYGLAFLLLQAHIL